MKLFKLLLVFIALGNLSILRAQSDGCSAATVIGVSANCSTPTAGTTTGATQTIPGCTGTADDDVWYQFTATSTSVQIQVGANAGFDPVVQLFSGACASLVSLVCKDDFGDGATETINYNGLTIGQVYRIRVYHYFAGSGTGNFTICVTNPPAAPSNDNCAGATPLTVNASCTFTTSTTDGASQSQAGCAGTADDDVWFSFVATNSLQNVLVQPIDNLDLVFQVFSGSCGSLNSLLCMDNTFSNQNEQSDVVGLIPGQTYFVRVYDYYQGNTGDFQICITGTPTPAPTNDEPCNAIQLPTVSSTCQYGFFTTNGATTSVGPPIPSSCVGGGGAQQGGFQSGTQDVWFSITVPASGNVDITSYPNGGAGYITDGVMALYSGSCGSLTQIACSDDNTAYPGSSNDLLPFISASGLTPGSTVYLRYWDFGLGSGNFGICASTATNDDCSNALYICDINGYSASTSAVYTPDRPGNMRGNAEQNNPPTYTYTPGTNSGGIFGQGGPWGTGSPAFDVQINNNSWIKFTAASTTATLNVNIYDCWVGNYPSGGIQMQIFSGTNCTNFVPVSNFEESSTGFTITANNLTVGNDYYLMVDGYAGDICNYTITANSGVQFPDITDVPPICEGQSVTLTAPPGATSYEWQHNGATTQTVNVTPSTTETYYCEVEGLCGYKQLLDVTVTVTPNPTVTITNGPSVSVCQGSSVTLTATGATSYSWNIPATGSSVSVSPTSNVSYTVTGTQNGCTNTANVNITVNPNPTLTANPIATDSDCGGSNGALTGASANGQNPLSYTWSNGTTTVGTNQNLSNIPAGTFFLTVQDGNSCSAQFGPFSVTNPGAPPAPTITVDDATPCVGATVNMTATSSVSGATFNWTGPNGFTSSNQNVALNNFTNSMNGTYCVSATDAGCTGPSSCQLVTLSPPPSVAVNVAGGDSTVCEGDSFTLDASGASSYVWSGPNGFNSTSATNTINNASSANSGDYIVIGTDANGCVNSDTIAILTISLPSLTVATDNTNGIYCGGGVAILTATGAGTYSWTGPNGYSSQGDTVIVLDMTSASQGYYVITGTNSEGCSSSDSVLVSVVTDVPASAAGDTLLCPGETLALQGSGGVDFTWTGPLNYYSEEQNPVVTTDIDFNEGGWYFLTVIDQNGCSGFDSTFVEVSYNAECLFIPNLITPDFDSKNDLWVIQGIEKYENAVVNIFNRWGNLIYTSSPYLNDWNGVANQGAMIDGGDERVPVGTYFYIIELNNDDKEIFKGYIEVEY